jgi:putative two-component system response regulator
MPWGGVRKKILYVDDVNHNLISVKNRLKSRYEVYPVPSVDMMFNTLEKITPDLILLDINMPHVDGYEAIMQLKTTKNYKKRSVIFTVFSNLRLPNALYLSSAEMKQIKL